MKLVVMMHVILGLMASAGSSGMADEYRVIRAFDVADEPACMPAMTRAPNGDVLVVFGTEWEPIPAGGVLKLVVSKDNGNTWSQPRILWMDNDPRVTIGAANGMQTLSNGDILLPINYSRVPKFKNVDPKEERPLKIYNCDPNNPDYWREVWQLRSRDNGRTWSRENPKFTPASPVVAFGRLLETRDGRLIKPCYWSSGSWYYESSDFGKTWGPKISLHKRFASEWNIVEAIDGTLVNIVRGAGGRPRRTFGTNFSQNGGKTWSEPRSAGVQGKMPDLLVLPSGRILMVVGAEGLTDGSLIVKQKDRYSFCTLFISDDHGQSWKRDIAFEQVHPGSSVVLSDSPCLVDLRDGRILVVMQASDRSQAGHALFSWHVGMSLIGNIIEPVR